ncbi:ashwin-like isoform X1 [Acipenser ruthenus]|uniref:ashwin-like isoform X1 n=1 Tax=Acipenser ruthenus TaxID=7906 RepID=UPI00274171D5|nr:ashwin-like isoform X1 [Acipenser ruthenus]
MKMAEGCVVGGGRVIGTNVEKNKHNRDLLLHPELLSRDFILLTLLEKKIPVDNEKYADKDRLTDLYLQHIIPLPQRDLPNSRWGKRMEKKRASQSAANAQRLSSGADGSRKRPILFDGSSTSTSIKLKKIEAGATDRLKPPPSGNLANTIRRLSNTSTNCSSDGSLSSASNNSIKHLPEMVVKQDRATTSYQNPNGNVKSTPASVTEASTGGTASMKLKRAAPKGGDPEVAGEFKSSETKKKIQHVTWP